MHKPVAVCLTLIAGFFPLVAQPAHAARERLLYETVEDAPGSKSQGWLGTLYDTDGVAMKVEPGQTVKTVVGVFSGVACAKPGVPCGVLPLKMLHGVEHADNVIMDENWSYRIFVVTGGARNGSMRGELSRGRTIVKPEIDGKEVKTPMGGFLWVENPFAFGAHGWVPQARPSGAATAN
jgi:hypothetical protein